MHFPKSLTESQNFSEIIPTEVSVPPLSAECRSLEESAGISVIFPRGEPHPRSSRSCDHPPNIVLLLLMSERGRFLTSNMQPEMFHLTSRRKKVGTDKIFLGVLFNFVDNNENSHSEYWKNLGTSVTEKSRKHLKRASVFTIYVRTAKQILVL